MRHIGLYCGHNQFTSIFSCDVGVGRKEVDDKSGEKYNKSVQIQELFYDKQSFFLSLIAHVNMKKPFFKCLYFIQYVPKTKANPDRDFK